MNFCIVAYKFGTENEIGEHLGTYHYFIEKMRRLKKSGHNVYVVAPWLSFFKKGSVEVDGVKIIRYFPPLLNKAKLFPINRIIRFFYIYKTQREVLKLDKKIDLSVVYVWQARETGYAISKIKNKLHCKFIFRQITAWRWHFDRTVSQILENRKWYKLISNLKLNIFLDPLFLYFLDIKSQKKYAESIYKNADSIVFVSKAAAFDELGGNSLAEKINILGVGIETDLFKPTDHKQEIRQNLGISENKIIIFIGRIIFSEKGLDYLLKAIPEIKNWVSGVKLIIIGDGVDREKMLNLIKDLKIENEVQWVGRKDFSELPKYLNASDLMVVPSVWVEHFGQVTIEAMSCGLPVITTNLGGSVEININEETGFVINPRDSRGIADNAIKLLLDDNLREKMGASARIRVLENYTYDVLVNKFIKIVENVR